MARFGRIFHTPWAQKGATLVTLVRKKDESSSVLLYGQEMKEEEEDPERTTIREKLEGSTKFTFASPLPALQ